MNRATRKLRRLWALLLALARRATHNGYVLFQDAFRVVIATGFRSKSANAKTGGMVQVWILTRHIHPLEAIKTGAVKRICGDCPHIGSDCYVQVQNAPSGIWKCYQRGGYPQLPSLALFAGRKVRFGAYGDPSYIPLPLVANIASVSDGWTGYTHQWARPWNRGFAEYLMASCDSVEQQLDATRQGWRTFRVGLHIDRRNPRQGWRLRDEINCPASIESGHRSSCERCLLCCGNARRGCKNVEIGNHKN